MPVCFKKSGGRGISFQQCKRSVDSNLGKDAKDYERGIRIADRRKAIGLSQDELAHSVGIGRQALSAIENGGDFKIQTLDNLAIVLGVSVDFIIYGKNDEKSELLSEAMDVLSDMDAMLVRQLQIGEYDG